ncbi:MAG: sugar ABC transporter permease [Chloroflexota bacterium]|nr:sugar ABC transporter permease [Chloroflexota bacterium]
MAGIPTKTPSHWRREVEAARTAYTYILPAAIIMAIITFFPLIFQLWMSVTTYSNLNLRTDSLLGQVIGSFVPSMAAQYNSPQLLGLDNYAGVVLNTLGQILSGFDFWRILLFNLVWTFSQVAFHVTIGVAVAILLNANGLWFKRFYRGIYIIPWALPSLVAAMVWKNMFDDQSGSVNSLLHLLGVQQNIRWLQQIDPPLPDIPPFVNLPAGANPWFVLLIFILLLVAPLFVKRVRDRLWVWIPWAVGLQILFALPIWGEKSVSASLGQIFPLSFFAVFVANVWLGWPFMMTVATGALQSIPKDLYEAGAIDGATGWQAFWNITAPLLRPAMVPAIMIGIMMTFNQFNIIYFVTGGGPLHQTEILVTQAYRFVNETTINVGGGTVRPYAVAAAFSYLIFIILAAITLVTNRVSRATEAYYE